MVQFYINAGQCSLIRRLNDSLGASRDEKFHIEKKKALKRAF